MSGVDMGNTAFFFYTDEPSGHVDPAGAQVMAYELIFPMAPGPLEQRITGPYVAVWHNATLYVQVRGIGAVGSADEGQSWPVTPIPLQQGRPQISVLFMEP